MATRKATSTKPAAAKPAPQAPTVALGKPYHPRAGTAHNTQATWASITDALQQGPQTQAQLVAIAKEHGDAPFVGYALRRGWLVVQQ